MLAIRKAIIIYRQIISSSTSVADVHYYNTLYLHQEAQLSQCSFMLKTPAKIYGVRISKVIALIYQYSGVILCLLGIKL